MTRLIPIRVRRTQCLIPALVSLGIISLAFGAAQFPNPAPTLVISTHISSVGQIIQDSIDIPLTHDSPCALSIGIAQAGDEQLHTGGNTLATSYKLTGAALMNPDADWVDAGDFLTHNYSIPGNGPLALITLSARGKPPTNTAPAAGTYNAALILTVSW